MFRFSCFRKKLSDYFSRKNAFETKNVIAQEAAAKALGLSRDELANMIMEQEKMEVIRAAGAKDMNELQEQYNKNT